MHPRLITVLALAVALVAAGCLDVAPASEDVSPTDAPAPTDFSTDAPWLPSRDPCVSAIGEPEFHPNPNEMSEQEGTVPATVTSGRLHVQSFFGGIYVVPWERPAWRVEVAEVDPDDRLTTRISGDVVEGELHLQVTIEDDGGDGSGVLEMEDNEPFAQVKAWVPATLFYHRVDLRDHPDGWSQDRSGMVNVGDRTVTTAEWNDARTRDVTGGELSVSVTNLAVAAKRLRVEDALLATVNGAVAVDAVVAETARASSTNGAVCVSGALTQDLLGASSTNGAVDVHDAQASDLKASSTNGAVAVARVLAADVALSSTNGAVEAAVTPIATGSVSMSSTNGKVVLTVPAGPAFGYDVRGSTVNGQATADMEDARVDRDDDGKSFHARTNGYGDRDVQTAARLSSVNGDVHAKTQ